MTENSPILFSHKAQTDHPFSWTHLDLHHAETEKWLRNKMQHLDPFVIDALLAEETRPRVTEIQQGALIILRGVNLNENANPEDMISIRLWLDADSIISVQTRPLKAVQDICQKMTRNKGPKETGQFITTLIHKLLDRMSPTLSDLDEKLDYIEEKMMDELDSGFREQVTDIRRQSLILRRYIAPQKDVIGGLRMSELSFLSQRHKRSLQESYDQNTKFVEDLDAIRERGALVKDEIATALSDRLNKNMYILSVISAIFLPLGFLTGLLGVNIGGIPGMDDPDAFYIFSVVMIGLTALQIIIFKKLKWF